MHTVVILHGWGQGKEAWRGAFGGYPDIRPIVFDLPGFGSEPFSSNAGTWGVPEYASWVREKIEKEKLENVILLGHSFGGRIVACVASEKPAWLSGLILYGAPCLYRPRISVRLKKIIAKIAGSMGFKGRYRGNPELTEADGRGLGEMYRRVVNYDQTGQLRGIAVPTLIILGEEDTYPPLRIAREMQQLIPGSKLSILPGLGHNAHLENPTLFYAIAKQFLENQ